MCPVIRVLGVFVPVRITEDDRSEPMSSQPNGAWLTQDAPNPSALTSLSLPDNRSQ
jgi:hypothetical protein